MIMKRLVQSSLFVLLAAMPALAQDPANSRGQEAAPPPGTGRMMQGLGDGSGQPLFGKITAIKDSTLDLAKPDGGTATVKITDKTEFRKDRQSAKIADFKVGDMVFVRADNAGAQGLTALLVAGRTGTGPGGDGPGVAHYVQYGFMGEMGKDFVVGEVKSVDAPKITVLRPDNLTQTFELTEETSLRKGRESVTMADIQPGDHVFVRGSAQNNVFVSKSVMVIPPEQWKRMQDMGMVMGESKAPADSKPNPPQQ